MPAGQKALAHRAVRDRVRDGRSAGHGVLIAFRIMQDAGEIALQAMVRMTHHGPAVAVSLVTLLLTSILFIIYEALQLLSRRKRPNAAWRLCQRITLALLVPASLAAFLVIAMRFHNLS